MRSRRDQGQGGKAKGYVKDKAGELLNNPELETEGEIERASGAVREAAGRSEAQGEGWHRRNRGAARGRRRG